MVGSSMTISGSGAGFSMPVMVSPMVMPVTPGDGHDVAYLGLFGVGALQSVKREQLGDLGLEQRSVALGDVDLFPVAQGSVKHARDGQAAQVVGVVEVGDQDLQRAVRVSAGRRNGGDDGFKERLQVLSGRVQGGAGGAQLGVGVEHGEIELVLVPRRDR